eukprot:CAMPEP_0118632088 /NCGR_PEP_ID=MMETSP0785-20121206/252_1 /TAXON_ID=91992 /ORGANISM="Bolidomonas pacifica, Strain CCMP 1866" /LENGTH=348 /DNA_ID=CAMNT_0006522823 /DNA_START=160 /DNA_END=1202 /DNA_ORIENTATION=-
MSDYVTKLTARRKLRSNNKSGSLIELRKSFKSDKSVKSDLKRSTAFVKRLKASDKDLSSMVRDSRTLNLLRYTEEIVSGVVECRCKPNEIEQMGELVEALESCYEGFAKSVVDKCKLILKGKDVLITSAPTPKEQARLRRLNIRLVVEMMSRGLVDESKFLIKHVNKLCGVGVEGGTVEDVQQILGVSKQGGVDLIGTHTRTAKSSGVELPPPELFVPDDSIGSAVMSAYAKVKVGLNTAHVRVVKMTRRAEKDRGLVGKLSDEREEGLKKANTTYENLKKTVEALGEALGEDKIEMREVEDEVDEVKKTGLSVATKHDAGEGELGPWEDAEQKRFYEDVPEFLERIP